MTTKLRILIDEDVGNLMAEHIQSYSGMLSVKYVREMPGFKGTDDAPLVTYANAEHRVLITMDTGINHNSYPPCTHSGILRITTHNKHEAFQGGILKRFFQSGLRARVKDCVTYVSSFKAEIHSHSGVDTVHF